MSDTKISKERFATLNDATKLVHGGTIRSEFGETSESLFLTSGYVYDSAESAEARFKGDEEGYIYSRFMNPTIKMFEERMIALEGADDARATATGMAAISASMLCFLDAGDHIVSAKALFGSCRYVVETLLPRYGVEVTLIDGSNLDQWKAAMKPNTKAVFFETPTNPTLELVDMQAVADIAHEAGALVIVDNVFATPYFQKPMEFGADVVCYSATKHIDGQGRCLGGIVLGKQDYIDDYLHNFMRQTGPSMSPFNAWVMLKGLETLQLRVEKAASNARKIADFLSEHPKVKRAIYPGRDDHPQHELAKRQMRGFGTMVAFEIDGVKEDAFKFMNKLEIISISNNLGDTKSLVTHPTTTTHQRLEEEERLELSITPSLVRLSVGIEHSDDLLNDISEALK
ncbi:MAG: O-succinylhomoserine sulfhydrylase [Rhizobiales bacterium]|nr:O-succinylhomoserine sulfhydrylase [Hyphomicrobiales bacterium]